jgi:hypothetical protein
MIRENEMGEVSSMNDVEKILQKYGAQTLKERNLLENLDVYGV